jgi:hypothetical protein
MAGPSGRHKIAGCNPTVSEAVFELLLIPEAAEESIPSF